MQLEIEERVDQAIRHLQPPEAKRITQALIMLQDGGL